MELKELLKPEFRVVGDMIFADKAKAPFLQVTQDVIDYGCNYDCIQKILKFTAEALAEKYERDFTELRWIKTDIPRSDKDAEYKTWFRCPKCNKHFCEPAEECPACMQRLLPPEGEGE